MRCRALALVLLAASASAGPSPREEDYRLNVGFAQREENATTSLMRFIPLWTYRHDKVYNAKDWLAWPLMTGYSKWSDTSEFFSLPLLTYARSDFLPGKTPRRLWVAAPILSGGTVWDTETGTHTFLPILSEFSYTPLWRDNRIISFWDVTVIRAAWDKRPKAGASRTWGLFDPFWRGGRTNAAETYGWMSPLFDYENDEGGAGGGYFSLMPLFLRYEWDDHGGTRVRPSGSLFERAWPIYLHDPHRGEHHILWPFVYILRAPDGDRETLFRPFFGFRQTPEKEEKGIGPPLWPLARGFPSDPLVVGHRLVQPFHLMRKPDASAVNVLWPLLFHHGSDRRGTETSALLDFIHSSRQPDPHGGEIVKTRVFPLFSKVRAERSRRTLIFPLLWGWEENEAGRYIRPLLIFKVRTGDPSWAKKEEKKP